MRVLLFCLLIFWAWGCQPGEILLTDESEFRQIAWNDLSEAEKATVIGDWREAPVEDASSLFPEREAVSVRFNTTQDPLLGPIMVFIDSETKEILGRGPRF
jgi:hypothetical protein